MTIISFMTIVKPDKAIKTSPCRCIGPVTEAKVPSKMKEKAVENHQFVIR